MIHRLRCGVLTLFLVACGSGTVNPQGPDAGTPGDPCAEVDCSGHGTCVAEMDTGVCECWAGWAGERCDACAQGYHPDGALCLPDDAGTANYALEIIQPQPGLDTHNRFYKAYPGLEYNVRIAAIGGVYPYNYEVASGPAGMTVDLAHGTLVWPSPTEAGSPHAVTVRVTDQAGTSTEVSWTITVTTEGFRFLDAQSGTLATDGGTGSIDNPWRSLIDMYEGNDYDAKYTTSYAGEFLYFKPGTYPIGDAYLENVDPGTGTGRIPLHSGKPLVWLAYPGPERPTLDLGQGYISVYGGTDHFYLDGFAITNMTNYYRKGVSMDPHDHTTIRRCAFSDLTTGGIGGSNNQSAIMITDSHAAFGNYFAFTDNTFDRVDSYAIIAYTSNKVLFADNVIRDANANSPGIGPKSNNSMWFIRNNRMYDIVGQRAIWLYNAGGQTTDQEVSYNLVLAPQADKALSVNQDVPPQAGPAHIFRNTFVGGVQFRRLSTTTGPFRMYDNVVVNDDASHIECSSCDAPEMLVTENNLTGAPGDGILDADGNLTGAYAAQCGRAGYQRSCN